MDPTPQEGGRSNNTEREGSPAGGGGSKKGRVLAEEGAASPSHNYSMFRSVFRDIPRLVPLGLFVIPYIPCRSLHPVFLADVSRPSWSFKPLVRCSQVPQEFGLFYRQDTSVSGFVVSRFSFLLLLIFCVLITDGAAVIQAESGSLQPNYVYIQADIRLRLRTDCNGSSFTKQRFLRWSRELKVEFSITGLPSAPCGRIPV